MLGVQLRGNRKAWVRYLPPQVMEASHVYAHLAKILEDVVGRELRYTVWVIFFGFFQEQGSWSAGLCFQNSTCVPSSQHVC